MFDTADLFQTDNEESRKRLTSLYKVFAKTDKQITRNSRINFWRQNIKSWCASTPTLIFTIQNLQNAYLRGTLKPQCLEDVLKVLISEGIVAKYNEAEYKISEPVLESWSSWSYRTAWSIPIWTWNKLTLNDGKAIKDTELLINIALLKDMSSNLYNSYWSHAYQEHSEQSLKISEPERLRTFTQFHKEVVKLSLFNGTFNDLEMCLKMLHRNNQAVTLAKNETLYVQLAKPGTSLQHSDVNQSEIVELELNASIEKLEHRIQQVETEVVELEKSIRTHVKEGRKHRALNELRRKKRLSALLNSHTATLDNMLACAQQFTDVRINKEVVSAFKSSASVLKSMLSAASTDDEAVRTMMEVEEMLSDSASLSSTISTPITPPEEEGELEKELEALLGTGGVDEILEQLQDIKVPTVTPDKESVTSEKKKQSAALPAAE